MGKLIVDRPDKFYHYYPTVAAIVVVKYQDNINAMSVAWNMGLSSNPPLYGILVAPKRYTHELIEKAKEFSVNFVSAKDSDLLAICGRISGREADKLKEYNIKLEPSHAISSPVIAKAYASYECNLYRQTSVGDHTLFAGEIVKVHSVKDAFKDNGLPELRNNMPNLYLGSDTYLYIKDFEIKVIDKNAILGLKEKT
ncbi:MAG TPA: flavin reductase family protein [bacterium]